MFEVLHLKSLPALPDDLKALTLTTAAEKKLIQNHLISVMSPDDYAASTTLLNDCVKGRTPVSIMTSLYHCGYETLRLYKDLIRLRDDVDIKTMMHHLPYSSNTIESSSSPEELLFAAPRIVDSEIVRSSLSFRFNGEMRHVGLEAEMALEKMSPTFAAPLQLLRQHYYKLNR